MKFYKILKMNIRMWLMS